MKWFAGVAALLVCASALASEVFKWTDEQGKVHYGDKWVAPDNSDRMEVNGESPRERRFRRQQEMRARWEEDMKRRNEEFEARKREEERRQAEAPPAERATPGSRFKPPAFDTAPKSVPVNPKEVAAACKGLADRISKVKPGEPWVELGREFDDACPGVAYECHVYKRQPKKDKCQWVKRTRENNAVVRTHVYE